MKIRLMHQIVTLLALWMTTIVALADYAEVNGISMYYEVHGNPYGTPVVMLHGGYDDSDMWAIETRMLAPQYRVIEIDSRGHGRSQDGASAITYEQMADDTLKLLDSIGIVRAHFVGWSDGAVIASQIAIDHPERVNQLVLFGAAFQSDAYVDWFAAALNQPVLFNAFIDSRFQMPSLNSCRWRVISCQS
ncbi:MAG: alpha/beta fold hydrolase [Hahellaceae bacterium]|nr:alpha/beta fold hydrolase [Hahellaceae bacterium]